MSGPRPLCTDLFYNRSGRTVLPDQFLGVSETKTEDAVVYDPRYCSVKLRVITEAAPDCVVECEIGLPEALYWRRR